MKTTNRKSVSDNSVSTALKIFSEKERKSIIQKEAYHAAYARGFEAGDALGDWLAAEKRVDIKLAK
ncbi:MAG: hypothetical protein ACI9Y1_002585 [Lentisphaeria bacterium]|jgi:hypothetical protein